MTKTEDKKHKLNLSPHPENFERFLTEKDPTSTRPPPINDDPKWNTTQIKF